MSNGKGQRGIRLAWRAQPSRRRATHRHRHNPSRGTRAPKQLKSATSRDRQTRGIRTYLALLIIHHRSSGYVRGSATTALVFAYTIAAGDGDHTAILINANSLALNGGTITSTASAVAADLAHNGKAISAGPVRRDGPQTQGPRA